MEVSTFDTHELRRGVGAETNSGAGSHKINRIPIKNQIICPFNQVILKRKPKFACCIHENGGCEYYSVELGRCKLSAPSDHEQLFG